MVMQRNGAAARRKEYYQILELLQQKKIPKSYPQADEKQQLPEDSLQLRSQILGLCGYCLLSYDWLALMEIIRYKLSGLIPSHAINKIRFPFTVLIAEAAVYSQ